MTKNTKKIDTALIGCGYWGTNIARTLINLKKCRLLVFDENYSNSKILKSRFPKNIIIEKKINNIFKSESIKNIILATPPMKNFILIKNAIKNKKNLFVEKPGLKNFSEINKISKIKNSRTLMFGYIYIYNNYINFIKKFISNKKNGKILYIKFQRQNLGPIRNDVSVSYDLSSHDLSILFYFLKKLPKKIQENSYSILKKNLPDISNLSSKIKNIYIDINNSWLNPDKVRRITIITTTKMLLFDEMKDKDKIKIYNKYAKYPKISFFDSKFFNTKAKIYHGKNYSPNVKSNDALKDELRHFFMCVKTKKKPITDINFAINILKTLKKIN